ncbi:YtpI family protein [Paenibacillus crassostreae]|uniref:YtpI-like protein n=1 Tax=Paenibacillus crassostreae TaxID=1763538 RepID=A0A167G1A8_9BACL|nr:YtpI family protein [Paenibacillus crassostreae]AOZ93859.1 hypothetical protein LPB68_17835 [Paenibacillus crassostreae]OAB77108.1 hypothetical protein PNBC_06900 [Paenibacillus crassostreae]
MLTIIKYILLILLVITCISAAYYSIRSHRSNNPIDRGLYGSITNIFMGIMLIMIAITFMFIFHGSTPSIIVEALFLVLGAFNIFAGLRNRKHYTYQKSNS